MLNRRALLLNASALGTGVATLGLTGCATPQVQDYANQTPALDLKTYFNGVIDAWGIFTDRSGKVVKRFTVLMNCHWSGEQGTLDEDFTYSDGSKQKRVWELTHQGDGAYTGQAGDVVGQAQGLVRGNAFNWHYTLALPVEGRIWNVDFDDWMFLMSPQIMLNRAKMSKFGIGLGEVTLSFTKRA
jgi:hypothetical protein